MERKTMIATLTAIALTATLAVPAAGLARGWGEGERSSGPRGAMLDFDALDADKDGRITREEITAFRAARAAAMDPDGDGFVTRDEMVAHATAQARAMIEARVDRMFARMDTDGDGRLGAAETLAAGRAGGMEAGIDRMFDRLDADGDGAVTRAELDAAMAARGEGRGDRMGKGRDGRQGHRMQGEGRHGHRMGGEGRPGHRTGGDGPMQRQGN